MKPLSQVYIYILVTLAVAVSQKDSDEGRPYEFGFTIDGQQHRHEKKDQNGIVQGEFGFITADGVYHVTVYATDENGNFKILSMRNLRISAPLDGSPATGPISPDAEKYLGKQKQIEPPKVIPTQPTVQLSSNQVPQSSQSVQVVTQKPVSYVFTTQSTIKPACGGCGYVTTQKPLSDQSFQFQNPAFKEPAPPASNIGGVPPASTQQGYNQQVSSSGPVPPVPFNDNYNQPPTSTGIGAQQGTPNYNLPQTNVGADIQQGVSSYSPQPSGVGSDIPQGGSPFASTTAKYELPTDGNQNQQNLPNQQIFQNPPGVELLPPGVNGQTQEAFSGQPQQFGVESGPQYPQVPPVEKYQPGGNVVPNTGFGPEPNTFLQPQGQTTKLPPITVSDNTIHVGGSKPQDIPIKDKYPGMADGLPNGIEEKDIKDILYKFHYTVGFHGHYEKGLKNGAKVGGYFVNGRDGISRVVTYVADENGYRPKFKFINLGLDSEDTPKEGTEKKFGLKSFEFVWYPIE